MASIKTRVQGKKVFRFSIVCLMSENHSHSKELFGIDLPREELFLNSYSRSPKRIGPIPPRICTWVYKRQLSGSPLAGPD